MLGVSEISDGASDDAHRGVTAFFFLVAVER
jgi:hypothetical protein